MNAEKTLSSLKTWLEEEKEIIDDKVEMYEVDKKMRPNGDMFWYGFAAGQKSESNEVLAKIAEFEKDKTETEYDPDKLRGLWKFADEMEGKG